MLQGEHSAILSTFIKIFVLSIFDWPLKTGFTVICEYFENVKDIIIHMNIGRFLLNYSPRFDIQRLKSVRCKSFGRKDICITVHIHTFTHKCIFTCGKAYVCAYVNINSVGE